MVPRLVPLFTAFVALAGCGAVSAISSATAPLDVFEVRAADQPRAARAGPEHVIIERPTTTGALDTDRIMIRPDALQAQYLPGVRWSDPAPAMLQTLMLRSLASTDAFSYVGRQPLGPAGDYAMLTELRDFQAELDPGGATATVRLRMTARLLREGDRRIVASRRFAAAARAPATDAPTVVAAFDAAAAELLTSVTAWAVQAIRAR